MRKIAYIFTLLLLAGCADQSGNGPWNPDEGSGDGESGKHIVFTASSEPMGTKLSLEGVNALWTVGDRITVIDASGNRSVYRSTLQGAETTFEYVSGNGPVNAPYTAWYPAELADGYICGAQPYADGNLVGIPMKAVSSSTDFHFKNLTGIVKVHLSGPHTDICALSLAAEHGMAGFFDTATDPGSAAFVSGPSTVALTPESPVDITGGRDFYFAVACGRYDSFFLTVLDSKDNLAYYSGTGVEVERSMITTIQDIDVNLMGNAGYPAYNLSSEGTANCYLITRKKDYKFYACAEGNRGSSSKDFTPVSADILWSSTADRAFIDLRPVILYNGYVYFRKGNQVSDSFNPGNAVVAVRDASGRVLWSWHIWMPLEDVSGNSDFSSSYANGAGNVMMLSLGETADGQDGGLFYQWGRKDPFPADYQSRTDFPKAIEASSQSGNSDYARLHPNQFIYGNDESCFDWAFSPMDNRDWGAVGAKGLDDPCPYGWHLPDGAGCGLSGIARGVTPEKLEGLWTVAFGRGVGFCGKRSDSSLYWDNSKKGILLPASVSGKDSWFAAGGFLDPEDGSLAEKGWTGSLWTRGCEPSAAGVASGAYCFGFGASGMVRPAGLSNRAAGRNVRCVED